MSEKVSISRNPADYPPKIHDFVAYMVHTYGRDEQEMWEEYFDTFAQIEAQRTAGGDAPAAAQVHLIARPPQ